jgi:RHS repeat-associated protein
MAGISSKAAGKLENRVKFNEGSELQSREFSDGTGLDWYETAFRPYDPQIGRFIRIDDIAEDYEDFSPYVFANNNPMLLNDELGLASDTIHGTSREVIVKGIRYKRSSIIIPINLPGHSVKRNPNYNLGDPNSTPFINYKQTQPYAWDDKVLTESVNTTETVATIIPLGRGLKFLKTLLRLNRLRNGIPDAAKRVAEYAKRKNGAAQSGYKGGGAFKNDGRNGEVLPQNTSSGSPITYKEYDINPNIQGVNRGAERVVIGSDGRAYYSNNHYQTFKEIKMK